MKLLFSYYGVQIIRRYGKLGLEYILFEHQLKDRCEFCTFSVVALELASLATHVTLAKLLRTFFYLFPQKSVLTATVALHMGKERMKQRKEPCRKCVPFTMILEVSLL